MPNNDIRDKHPSFGGISSKNCIFLDLKNMAWTDERKDGRSGGTTDILSYRDNGTNLKTTVPGDQLSSSAK